MKTKGIIKFLSLTILTLFIFQSKVQSINFTAKSLLYQTEFPKLDLLVYNQELGIEKGWTGFLRIEVINSGNVKLHGVYIKIEGVYPGWVEIPKKFDLDINQTKASNIKFTIPENAKSGNYQGKIVVSSLEGVGDEKSFILRIFSSRAELIYYQIQTLKNRVNGITDEMFRAEEEGKDVEIVKKLLKNSTSSILIAENYLNNKLYDKASEVIVSIKSSLNKAEDELKNSKPVNPSVYERIITTIQNLATPIIIITISIFGVIAFVSVKRKSYQIKLPLKIPSSVLEKFVILPNRTNNLEKEKEKIEKILLLLEKEYREGIISKESYEELKNKNEERLFGIEKKIKGSSKITKI